MDKISAIYKNSFYYKYSIIFWILIILIWDKQYS